MTFFTRRAGDATVSILSPSRRPFGPPVRGRHLAMPSTKVRQNPPDPLGEGGLQPNRYSADYVKDLRRQPHLLQLRHAKRYREAWRRHAGNGAGPPQHKLPLLQKVRPIQERLRRLQGSSSEKSATQTTAAQAARRTSAEPRRVTAGEGRGANVVLLPQDHHP